MSEGRKLSVIIVTYNRYHDLIDCLNSLFKLNQKPYEIIVVDSNSTDFTPNVKNNYPVKFFSIAQRSMVKARNIGLQKAEGEIVAFLDDDVIVSQDWANHILKPYSQETVGGVGGRVLQYYQNKKQSYTVYQSVGKIFDNGFVSNNYDLPHPTSRAVDALIGCNMSFRRSLLLKVGGFDENFKGSCFRDDTDISVRIRRQGCELIYAPKAVVWHKYKGKKVNCQWFYWYAYNHFYFCFKNLQPVNGPKLVRLIQGAFFPPANYVRRAGIHFHPDPRIGVLLLLGILDARKANRLRHLQDSLQK